MHRKIESKANIFFHPVFVCWCLEMNVFFGIILWAPQSLWPAAIVTSFIICACYVFNVPEFPRNRKKKREKKNRGQKKDKKKCLIVYAILLQIQIVCCVLVVDVRLIEIYDHLFFIRAIPKFFFHFYFTLNNFNIVKMRSKQLTKQQQQQQY